MFGVDVLIAPKPSAEAALRFARDKIVGAIYSPIDESGDSAAFTRSLAQVASREHGPVVCTNTTVEGLIVAGNEVRAASTNNGAVVADKFVLATGGALNLAGGVGIDLPIYPMKGYSVTLPTTPDTPSLSLTDTAAKIVFCRLGSRLRIAGLAELGRADDRVDQARVTMLIRMAQQCLPSAAQWRAAPEAWAGLRPMTPDSRPIIGKTRLRNLFLNCGHGMLGWTLACGSAELLTSLITEERPADEGLTLAEDFALSRA